MATENKVTHLATFREEKSATLIASFDAAFSSSRDIGKPRANGIRRPIQSTETGYNMIMTDVKSVISNRGKMGGARMPDEISSKSNASSMIDLMESHKKLTDQRIDSLEKMNGMQFEHLQKESQQNFTHLEQRLSDQLSVLGDKITSQIKEQQTATLDQIRTERKEDHKYIFNSLIGIIGVTFAIASIAVSILVALLT